MDLFEDERATFLARRAEYEDAIAKIDAMLAAMGEPSGTRPTRHHPSNNTGIVRRRRPMTAAARAAASKRMKAYWRDRRKAGGK